MLEYIQVINRSYASTATRSSSLRWIYAFTILCTPGRRRSCARRAVKRSRGGTRCGVTRAVIQERDLTGCNICGQSFTQFTPMAIHKRLHTGERPYPCDLCSKAFVSRSTMMTHRKKHDKKGT
ncbi:hypothetical protein WDU94_005075 [Cyamophila willieti]